MRTATSLSVMRCLPRTAPVSGRYEGYEVGHSQPSFDKQFARDWLTSHPGNDWTLPEDVVQKTIDKYLQSYEMLTGEKLK